MSDSPWARSNSPSADARPSRPVNWAFFLLINLGIGLPAGIANQLLQNATGFAVPDVVVNLAVLYVTVTLAGNRWLKGNGQAWTRQDRHRLALAYMVVNAVITCVVLGLFAVLVMNGYGAELGLPPEVTEPGFLPVFGVVLAILLPLVLWANYGLNRLVLFHVVNKNARPADDISKEFA